MFNMKTQRTPWQVQQTPCLWRIPYGRPGRVPIPCSRRLPARVRPPRCSRPPPPLGAGPESNGTESNGPESNGPESNEMCKTTGFIVCARVTCGNSWQIRSYYDFYVGIHGMVYYGFYVGIRITMISCGNSCQIRIYYDFLWFPNSRPS